MLTLTLNGKTALISLLAEAQEELTLLGSALVQASERLGAPRVRQALFALLLLLCQWRKRPGPSGPDAPRRPCCLSRAQAFHLLRRQRRTLAALRRFLSTRIAALRPVSVRHVLPLPRACSVC